MRLRATDAKHGPRPMAKPLRVQALALDAAGLSDVRQGGARQPVVRAMEITCEHVNLSYLRALRAVGSYTCRRMALTSPECTPTRMDNLVILHDDQPVGPKVRIMEAKVRQHVKIGVATAVTALALFGGATPASACSEADADPDLANVVGSDLAEQFTCQVGEGNKNITINQTNNISIGGDLDGDLNDFIFPPELD